MKFMMYVLLLPVTSAVFCLIKFHIKPDLLPQLNKKLADATAGEVQAVFDEEKYYAVEL